MSRSAVFAISNHGYGHVAQVAPVIEAFHRQLPDVSIFIAAAMSPSVLRSFVHCPFELIDCQQDPGIAMNGPLRVDAAETFRRYSEWHRNGDCVQRRMRGLLEETRPSVVVSDVGYSILTAAQALGIPSLAFSSLNWADIVAPYCRDRAGMETLYEEILAAYNAADRFVQVEPSMPMPGLRRVTRIGPVARTGVSRRRDMLRQLRLPEHTRLVVFTLGGIPCRTDFADWAIPADTHWLVPHEVTELEHFTQLSTLGIPYIDVLASADVLVTKPGYGNFTEAAVNGIPVVYVRRGDWPEEPALVDWLNRWGNAVELAASQFAEGNLQPALESLAELSTRPPVQATGVEEAADIIAESAALG